MENLIIQNKKLINIKESEIFSINEYIYGYKINRKDIYEDTANILIQCHIEHEEIITCFYDRMVNLKFSRALIGEYNDDYFIIKFLDF